jgi:hypothetical protein
VLHALVGVERAELRALVLRGDPRREVRCVKVRADVAVCCLLFEIGGAMESDDVGRDLISKAGE